MRFLTIATVAVVSATSSVFAAEKMNISIEQARIIAAGLEMLDGYQHTIKESGSDKYVADAYDLSGPTRMLIAKNKAALRPVVEQFNVVHNGLVTQFSGGASKVPDEKTSAFNSEERRVLDSKVDVDLSRLKLGDLKLEKNPIPASALQNLLPIIDE